MRSTLALLSVLLALAPAPAQAQRLPTIVTPEHYDLSFVVDLRNSRFDGNETIHVNVAQATPRIVLNAAEIEFNDVTVGTGAAAQRATVTLDAASQTAALSVPKPVDRGATDIHIRYKGVLNDELRGFY